MKMVKVVTILCAAIVLALSCIAEATPVDTVDIVHTGFGASDIIKIWGGGHSALRGYGGVYMLNKTAGTGQGNFWPDGSVGTFCIELSEWTPDRTLTYDVVKLEEAPQPYSLLGGPMDADKAEYISELWGRFFDPMWVGSAQFTCQQKKEAEAFAAAVWEIIYEDLPASPAHWDVKVDGTAGELGFRCEQAARDIANNWLHALDGTGPKANLRAFVYNGKQDYIAEVPVPEPATVFLLSLGSLILLRPRCK